jgi:hypothetical protein
MRGNVLFRAQRYEEARPVYEEALAEFRTMREPRGAALARLGLVKTLAHLGQDQAVTAAELDQLGRTLDGIGLRHTRDMVDKARAELGVEEVGRR